jgi:hypothetical protein
MSGVLKTSKFLDDSYDKRVEFLHTIKKPTDPKPTMFFNALLSFHNVMLAELPGVPQDAANAMFSPSVMQYLYLHAMSVAWQERCEDASKTMHNSCWLRFKTAFSISPRRALARLPTSQDPNNKAIQAIRTRTSNLNKATTTGCKAEARVIEQPRQSSCLSQEQLELTPGPLPGHADHAVSQCHQRQFQE